MGKNGSGKSNLLDAIQFVLSAKYSSRAEDRSKLLYEGAGREIIAATVELIFDNADLRFPVDKEEVSIRRSIGMKKDEFFLNNRHMSRAEITSLLESAGLSRSNPYYMVQQGKINQLIKMRDSERLELLKEIAGTRTYDERRKESIKIMRETDTRREAIGEIIDYLEQRLTELEQEKSELREYQQLDLRRRMIEYTVYDKEYQHAVEKLAEVEGSKAQGSADSERLYDVYAAARKRREEAEEKLAEMEARQRRVNGEKKAAQTKRKEALGAEKEKEMQVRDGEERVKAEAERERDTQATVQRLQAELTAKTREMKESERAYDAKRREEEEAQAEVRRSRQRLDDLNAKQGRGAQFANKRERDVFLQGKRREMVAAVQEEEKKREEMRKELSETEEKMGRLEGERKRREEEMAALRTSLDETRAAMDTLQGRRDLLMNEKKELQREEQEGDDDTVALDRREKEYASIMDNEVYRGIQSINRYLSAHPDLAPSVYGPVIDLFSVDANFNRAVEVGAGAALFHVVVATDAVASTLIAHLNATRGGRVTFIPLNRIQPQEATPPKTPDALPLLSNLRFDPRFRPVMVSIFSRVLVCRDLQAASNLSSAYDFTTLTLNGDKVERKGAITGGWIDSKRSRLQVHAEWKEGVERAKQRSERRRQVTEDIAKHDADITAVLGELHRMTEEVKRARRRYETLQMEGKHMQGTQQSMQDTAKRLRDALRRLDDSIALAQERVRGVDEEIRAPFSSELSAEEQRELASLIAKVRRDEATLADLTKERTVMEIAQQRLASHIRDNLDRRLAELNAALTSLTMDELRESLEQHRRDLRDIAASRSEHDALIAQLDSDIDGLLSSTKRLQSDIERYRADELAAKATYNELQLQLDAFHSTRAKYQHKKEECQRKIRDLGSLQLTGQEAVRSRSVKQLLAMLEDLNKRLLAYAHVNKKAMDQYVSLVEQREDLTARKDEQDAARVSIMDLIDHLDMKKDEAIERTFKQIAQHFSAVFAEIVPGGKGQLVIQTRREEGEETEEEERARKEREKEEAAIRRARQDRGQRRRPGGKRGRRGEAEQKEGEGEEEEEKKEAAPPVPALTSLSYTGIGIKVQFAAGTSAATHQLSGGQESVVALSLIFAIQRCDPSPFYLFDEIDSALDPVHRAAVASMISKQKGEAQFIATTFSAEMIEDADRSYGVVFQNKVSKVRLIDREEALELVRMEEREAEGRAGQAGDEQGGGD